MPTKEKAGPDADLQVYEPHRAGLPKFGPYFRDLASRLNFAAESSRASIRAAHSQTVFGQIWLILNPLLLACVYYLLVVLISHRGGIDYLAHIVAGVFVFQLVAGSMGAGASSVTGGGKLILNIAFPRLLLPLGAVRTTFFRFLPTLPVYLLLRAFSGEPWSWEILLGAYFLGLMVVFSIGLAALFAALSVYFRDTASFLPFITRIWLYLSPILWMVGMRPEFDRILIWVNPIYSMVGGWSETTLLAEVPAANMWIMGTVWALVSLVGGCLFFMSRERDFAVRI